MAVRSRPAASLIALWRDGDGVPFVFMGRRHESLRFLPGVMVFPGGRVERTDGAAARSLDQQSKTELDFERPMGPSPDAVAAAALRECLEETGLDAAQHIKGPLRYIARAITPPHLPVRYDTHFLLADVHGTAQPPQPEQSGDGELIEPAWYSPTQLADLKLHHVTRHVLDFCFSHDSPMHIAIPDRALISDRKPTRWRGREPVRSRDLRSLEDAKS